MYLLDTNVLLKYPSVLSHFDGEVALSIRVLEEIDGLKKNSNPEVAYEARRASHKILKVMDKIHFELKVNRKVSVDDSLIELAKKRGYTLITNDLNVIIKSNARKVKCQSYDKVETNYTGVQYYTTELDENSYNEELEKMLDTCVPPMEMRENEFLIVKDQNGDAVCNLIFKNGKLKLLNGHAIKSDYAGKITPRNLEQDCLMELLYDGQVSIIAATGEYGTGKSYILTNFALQQLSKGKIDKIVYVPNNSIVENARELGTLPGDTTDKELVYMGPILDIVGEDRARDMILHGQIEVVPISVMRGRSFNNAIVLINEAQNLTTEHIKLLIARCGERTRIFFDGDIKQSDSHVFKNKSGLKLLLHLSKSEEYASIFGTVRLNSIERSRTAQASAYLDNLLI
jgi:predicted ribonuclease YlaK